MANLREATEDAKAAVADFRGDKGPVKGVTADLQQSLASARGHLCRSGGGVRGAEAQFLLPRLLQQRATSTWTTLRPIRTRAGALESKERRVLRVWVGNEVLFGADANGVPQLTEDGKRRLDSAMAAF